MTLIFTNGFESYDETETEETATNDGWKLTALAGEYREFDIFEVDATIFRTGTKAIYPDGSGGTDSFNCLYRTLTAMSQFELIFYYGHKQAGAQADITSVWNIGVSDGTTLQGTIAGAEDSTRPSNGVEIQIDWDTQAPEETVNGTIKIITRKSGTSTTVYTLSPTVAEWALPGNGNLKWFGLKLQVTNDFFRLYADWNDD